MCSFGIDLKRGVFYNIIKYKFKCRLSRIRIIGTGNEVTPMKKPKITKSEAMPLAAMAIIFICYAAEKAFKRLTEWGNTSALIQAFFFTLATAAVFLLLSKSKNTHLGILAGIFAFKIMPPDIVMLRSVNLDAACVYYIVRKAALVLFLYSVYKLYKSQSNDAEKLRALPIASLLLVIPFATSVSETLSKYAYIKTGSMMVPYALGAGFFVAAAFVLMVICNIYSGKNAALICDYAVISFALNFARKVCSVAILASGSYHISKSYYCWFAIYAVLIAAFMLVKSKTAKSPSKI